MRYNPELHGWREWRTHECLQRDNNLFRAQSRISLEIPTLSEVAVSENEAAKEHSFSHSSKASAHGVLIESALIENIVYEMEAHRKRIIGFKKKYGPRLP